MAVDVPSVYLHTKDLSVLLVEDYRALREELKDVLEEFFRQVDAADDGQEGLERYIAYHEANRCHYDLVISDIRMPRMDGITLVKALYEIHELQPVIMLSAHQEVAYLLELVNLGVAQFIPKPVQHSELLETLYKVCRRIRRTPVVDDQPKHLISITPEIVWDKQNSVLKKNGTAIKLTRQEMVLLEVLANKFEYICSAEEILSHFYLNDIDLNTENIRSIVNRLRKKIPPNAINSLYGLGYKLTSPQ